MANANPGKKETYLKRLADFVFDVPVISEPNHEFVTTLDKRGWQVYFNRTLKFFSKDEGTQHRGSLFTLVVCLRVF